MIKVIIYDDQDQFRDSLTILIGDADDIEVVAAFDNCETVIKDIDQLNPDILLMDIEMPGMSGIEAVKKIREVGSNVKILMLTVFEDNQSVFEALRHGANGYILKKTVASKLITQLREAYEGGAPMTASIASQVLKMFTQFSNPVVDDYKLSEREKSVLHLLVDGNSYKMVASNMQISIDTVRSHIRNIYEKLHVNSKSEAVAKAIRDRIV